MNTQHLEVGQIHKNYKELCSVLGEKVKTGNSKERQLVDWSRYFKWEKEGNKFIIIKIHEKPLNKIDNRKLNGNISPYIKDAEILLIDLLLCGEGELLLPNTALLQALKFVNHNYSKYYGYNRPLLANGLNIDLELVHDYYNNVNSSLVGNLKTVISRLEKKKLLFHKEVVMVKVVELDSNNYNENGNIKLYVDNVIDHNGFERVTYKVAPIKTKETFREATNEELRAILRVQRETMIKLGLNKDDKYNVLYKEGLTFKFNKIVNDRLLKEYNILRSFKSHQLIFNNDHLEEERIDLLDELEKELIQNNINQEVRNRILDNAKNRSKQANELLVQYLMEESEIDSKTALRSDKGYKKGYEKLNNYLIDNKLNSSKAKKLFNIKDKNDSEEVILELPELM